MANKASVVLATYRQPQFLPLALASIMDQTYTNLEIIVVTVKGDDETANLVAKYPVVHVESDKANYIHQRNLGIEKATGEYMAFFDSDDFSLPYKIEQEMSLAEEKDAVLIYSTYIRCDGNLVPIIIGSFSGRYIYDVPAFPPPSYQALLQNCYIYDFSLVHKSMYKEFGVFDVELRQAAMYDKWLHIMELYPHRIAYNPHATFLYRTYEDQMHLTEQKRPEHVTLINKVRTESLKRYQSPERRKAMWQSI